MKPEFYMPLNNRPVFPIFHDAQPAVLAR